MPLVAMVGNMSLICIRLLQRCLNTLIQECSYFIYQGHLSERMSQAGSAWMEAWESADAKSVRKQKRLFDERVEAEKVHRSVVELALQLRPLIIIRLSQTDMI